MASSSFVFLPGKPGSSYVTQHLSFRQLGINKDFFLTGI